MMARLTFYHQLTFDNVYLYILSYIKYYHFIEISTLADDAAICEAKHIVNK